MNIPYVSTLLLYFPNDMIQKRILLLSLLLLPLTACLGNTTQQPGDVIEPDSLVTDSAPSGHRFETVGYIKKLYTRSGTHAIQFDAIEWLAGREAAAAMREDDVCSASGVSAADCSPANGFYVRNTDEAVQTYPLADELAIFMQTRNAREMLQDEQISYTVFEAALKGGKQNIIERYQAMPFWIETNKDGQVTAIREQYVP